MSPIVKKTLNWSGSVLAITGIFFVFFRFKKYSAQLEFVHLDAFEWFILAGFALLYVFANILLAFAWSNLLKYFGTRKSGLWVIKTYGSTQLAKYAPGNIMHLASRQAIGMASGVSGWVLAKSTIWELGLLSFTSTLFFILTLPNYFKHANTIIIFFIFFGIFLIIFVGLKNKMGLPIATSFSQYIFFLAISGLIFVGILELLIDKNTTSIQTLYIIGSYVIAWLAGFVTPGAPAGVGVRELVLLMFLKGQINEAGLLMAILLSRLIMVVGDVLFFLFAILIDRWGILSTWGKKIFKKENNY